MNLEYMGHRLPYNAQITFEMEMKSEAQDWVKTFQPSNRTITIDLAPGQRWPDQMKRGRPVIFDVQGYRFDGRIAWRRMRRLVVEGKFR